MACVALGMLVRPCTRGGIVVVHPLPCAAASLFPTPSNFRLGSFPPSTLTSAPFVHHLFSQNLLNTSLLPEYGQLLGSLVPAGLAFIACKTLRTGSANDIAIAISRSSLQLLLLAFALKLVFEGGGIPASVLAITFMVLIAGHTAGERARQLPSSRLIATSSLAVGVVSTLGLMILLHAFPLTPRFLIPTAGYIIGSSMSMVGATLIGLNHDIRLHKGQIEAALALGASPQQAVRKHIQRAVVQGMKPWIDSIKTAGLITVPGSMTGMLIGGVRPLEVVQMQVQLLYMLLGAAALSSALSSQLAGQALFSKSHQLIV